MPSIRGGCCLAMFLAGPALAVGPTVLESGSYEVEVRLEPPPLQDMTGKKVVRLCLASHANGDKQHRGQELSSCMMSVASMPS